MRVGDKHYRSIWLAGESGQVEVIDQRLLPFEFRVQALRSAEDAAGAIRDMMVRGAPLIGVTAAYGMYLGAMNCSPGRWRHDMQEVSRSLQSTRPTAVNLKFALDLCGRYLDLASNRDELSEMLLRQANQLAEDEVERCRLIGIHGVKLIRKCYQESGSRVNILTHCNAGWLACVDYGTATAPMYQAFEEKIPIHVWVDETRPRNQGARLTAFELGQHGIDHTVIVDNAGGHLMQQGQVDLVMVGSDRTSRRGDVANKIGTYLKALAARDNQLPFYVALPTTTIDPDLDDGFQTPIEGRLGQEVSHMEGWDDASNQGRRLRILPGESKVENPGFDVTPARLVSGLITERGLCEASETGIKDILAR